MGLIGLRDYRVLDQGGLVLLANLPLPPPPPAGTKEAQKWYRDVQAGVAVGSTGSRDTMAFKSIGP